MSSLTVTQRPVSRPTLVPTDSCTTKPAAPALRDTVKVADAFVAASARPVALGAPMRGAAFASSASVESLFGTQPSALSVQSGRGLSTPTVPQVELEPGAFNGDVKNLQDCLVAMGYLSQETMNTNPGFFGENTQAAVRAFQADHGLEQAGRYGPGTRAAMNAAVGRLASHDAIIDNAYRTLLGRAPDDGGKMGWRRGFEQQAAAGASVDQLRASIDAGIKASPEYKDRIASNVTPQKMVSDLYNEVMERPADPGGSQHFLNRYNQLAAQGMGKPDIRNTLAHEMRQSPEYNVKETVKDLYRGLLGREADPVGKKSWTDYGMKRLAQGADINTVRNEISAQIMQSQEYRDRAVDPTSLGSLSARYESNGNPGTVSGGVGDPGGVSYGAYQFASNTGSVHSFVSWLAGKYPDFHQRLAPHQPGSAGFSNAWRALAAEQPDRFLKAQHDRIATAFYEPVRDRLNDTLGMGLQGRSKALNEVVWSVAVQHGQGGAVSLFHNALAGRNPAQMSDADVIRALYAERGRTNANGTLVYFSGSSWDVQQGVANRFRNEQADALRMLASEGRA